ncbi:MAG: hypothetical protein ACW98D_03695 [Promethearchaeota archaeon]|jgi:hypothetical protein
MGNKGIIAIIGIIFIDISLLITIPILSFSSNLRGYGRFNETLIVKHDPINESSIQKLNLNVEVGNIEIKYVNPPLDYVAKIEVNIKMSGLLLTRKLYSDYFVITNESIGSQLNFSLNFKSDVNKFEVSPLLENVIIIVFLRADIIFDIFTSVDSGNVDLTVPYGVNLNNVDINITTGKSLFNFNHCTFNGNFSGIVDNGDIVFNTYNVEYARNIEWMLLTTLGEITVDITHLNQTIDMNANISGTVVIETGELSLNYEDNTIDVSAMILFEPSIGPGTLYPGFDISLPGGNSYLYTSMDYPAKVNYNLTFNLIDDPDWQESEILLSSFPY